ncbi:hypothetical protein K3495_g13105 [Podosphaera aphanis]|nr:hypothetical protein K3495_g13105 [Podosphaera aphanis]
MSNLIELLLVYVIGGVTFPFLLIAAIFTHAYFTLPIHDDTVPEAESESLLLADDFDAGNYKQKTLDEKFQSQERYETEVAAGYFAVSRDYIPGGMNGRPPERATPTGSATVTSPSPSVYQSMYRSIFDRKPSSSPLDKGNVGKPQKKGSNIFYIVLRHGHLMLFDDDEQLEVRHVISLAHHDVSIYSGGDETPEGELFIKRNALCLSRRTDLADMSPEGQASKPFFLFSENCSEKEDFYFALLRNQEKQPKPLQYEVKDIIKLVQKLHSSDEHVHTRWINAVIGRIFLALYKTSEVENFFRSKITKKISRVKTPAFLSKIVLQNIDMGESAPIITNPKLKDLTVNGELVIEADLRYSGNSRIEVAATARIDLGARFKAREVNLVLAVNIKKIEGHVFLRIKPPPSNRFWLCFQTQPKIDLVIEPIVSSRQITYTLILRQIENRIKEVVAESLVFPNWDDSPFFGTETKPRRGGIWADNANPGEKSPTETELFANTEQPIQTETEIPENEENLVNNDREESNAPELEAANSTASKQYLNHTFPRKSKPVFNFSSSKSNDASTGTDAPSCVIEKSPKPLRSGSFPGLSSPVVSTDSVTADTFKSITNPENSYAVAAYSALSQFNSSTNIHEASPPQFAKTEKPTGLHSSSLNDLNSEKEPSIKLEIPSIAVTGNSRHSKLSSSPPSPASLNNSSIKSEGSSTRSLFHSSRRDNHNSNLGQTSPAEPKRLSLATMTNAAATATKWGWNALQRNGEAKTDSVSENNLSRPLVMGRGQPLPPPGVPLPPPGKKTKTAPIPVPKRKSMPPPDLSLGARESKMNPVTNNSLHTVASPPLLPKRRQQSENKSVAESYDDGLLIVPAPLVDSEHISYEDGRTSLLATGISASSYSSVRRSVHRATSGSFEETSKISPALIAAKEQESDVYNDEVG